MKYDFDLNVMANFLALKCVLPFLFIKSLSAPETMFDKMSKQTKTNTFFYVDFCIYTFFCPLHYIVLVNLFIVL